MTQNYPADVYVSKSASDPRAASDINQLQDDVKAHADDYITGWITAGETWVYASATTLTVTGDRTSKYRKGTKIKLTQTTAKYFYVVASSYAAPNTTVTLAAGSDYTLANATITSPFYSYADCPQDFPDWFNWLPTCCGFGAYNPSASIVRFVARGKWAHAGFYATQSGSSGANTFSMLLPIVAACTAYGAVPYIMDGAGSTLAGGIAEVIGGGCTLNLYKSACAVWTTTGSKNARFAFDWEF